MAGSINVSYPHTFAKTCISVWFFYFLTLPVFVFRDCLALYMLFAACLDFHLFYDYVFGLCICTFDLFSKKALYCVGIVFFESYLPPNMAG